METVGFKGLIRWLQC